MDQASTRRNQDALVGWVSAARSASDVCPSYRPLSALGSAPRRRARERPCPKRASPAGAGHAVCVTPACACLPMGCVS